MTLTGSRTRILKKSNIVIMQTCDSHQATSTFFHILLVLDLHDDDIFMVLIHSGQLETQIGIGLFGAVSIVLLSDLGSLEGQTFLGRPGSKVRRFATFGMTLLSVHNRRRPTSAY